uniref:regulation of nuclear pre-mRNA domain-containing protein 2a n=1 Tax=Monopterus albus TaxID=43700 RepID=UPI0009B31502|nr:regulation of nuclear pre-mRNA domain-containing protein 2-like [Monopterus albus]
MAAGAGATLSGSLESTLDRKFQSVTNTMDSIQGLSAWCIENKKYHSFIVRHWMKSLRKSNASHRLNLFYLANDVIQNCKRKNAIVYRTAFADVLPEAFLLVNRESDVKMTKSVERILSIWEDRGVYSGTLIADLRSSLVKEDSPPETPVEQKTPVESKADLQSKVVAEFVPQALIDQLFKYKRSMEEVDLREKQLAAMRVDICSSNALKKLKDKAGGKKFSKDFEEGSTQLQEFVKFFDKQIKTGPTFLQALSNADIFYEMQYKEVKIVANAYQTFANRVSHLKRKLDSLKSTLPDLDDSPLPSPSADAPSPMGSESSFHELALAHPDPDLDGSAMDDEVEPPAPSPLSSVGGSPRHPEPLGENDNREVEDMELSEEEMGSGDIIVEEQIECSPHPEVSTTVPESNEPSAATEQPVKQVMSPVASSGAALDNAHMGKIGSILNSLSSVMKNTGPLMESPPAATPGSSVKPTSADVVPSQDASSLVDLLSKVDMNPAELLSALSRVQEQGSLEGITSLLSSPAANVSSDSLSTGKTPPSSAFTSASAAPSQSLSLSSVAPVPSSQSSTVTQSLSSQAPLQTTSTASALVQALHRDMDLTTEPEPSLSSKSLESKIHSFLQENPAFSAFDLGFSANPVPGGDNLSPVTGTDTQDGTPVRDEGGGTPTQDEIMDKPVGFPFVSNTNQSSFKTAPFAHQNIPQQISNFLQQRAHLQPPVAQNGQVQHLHPYDKQEGSQHRISEPVAYYQQISAHAGGPVPGERAPGSSSSAQTVEGFQGICERGWYSDTYPEGNSQQPGGYSVTAPGGAGENKMSGLYPCQAERAQELQELASQQIATTSPGFFTSNLPPVPNLPPPPRVYDTPPSATISTMIAQDQQPIPCTKTDVIGATANSVISGMVVHDHQHKSLFHAEELPFELDRPHLHHQEDLHPHPQDLRYQEELEQYHDELRRHDVLFFQDDPYHHPDDPYIRPGSPRHYYPRGQGRLTPPISPSEDPYFAHEFQRHSPPPPHYGLRRPPPHLEMHYPGLRPPPRPPHPAHHPHPRAPPHAPFPQFHGPDPMLRGKRPGPRGRGNAGPMFPPKRPFPPPRY